MSFTATQIWEVQTGGSDTANGGGFDPANGLGAMLTDGAATSATGSSPVFTSASYNFQSSDVGAWVFIRAGTNWLAGWYKIASVASNAATLSAGTGAGVQYANFLVGPTTVAGCATTASPTGATWTIDYSQQSTGISLTGLTTTAASATVVTTAATKVWIGNTIQITGGTNFTTGFYTIQSVTAGTSFVVSSPCTTAAGVAGTGGVGGALASPGRAGGLMVSGNIMWIKSGTYTLTSSTYNVAGGPVRQINGSFSAPTSYRGYTVTRGDRSTKPVINAGSVSSVTILENSSNSSDYIWIDNIEVNGNSQSSVRGISLWSRSNTTDCTARNCTNSGIYLLGGNTIFGYRLLATGCTTTGYGVASQNSISFVEANSNTIPGILVFSGSDLLSFNNTGATTDGIVLTSANGCMLTRAVSSNNGRHGVNVNTADNGTVLANLLCWGNGGYAVGNTRSIPNLVIYNLAAGGNTSGRLSNTFVEINPITLTADPAVNAAGGNYGLNTAAGGGALCRGTGIPGAFPDGTTTGYADIGAVQSQASGGSSGGFIIGG